MECTGFVAHKFIKALSRKDICSDVMKLPFDFQQKYANMLPQEFGLNLRTGYRLPVHFDKITGIMMGMSTFYSDFGFKGGEVLVFEYYGQSDMNVYVLGLHSCEIDYPMITHLSQCGNPLKPKIRDGGWKFVHFINNLDQLQNEISVPPKFVENCGGNISKFLHFILSNGKSFEGRFCVKSNKLSGLIGMCKLLGLDSLNSFHVLLFTYDGHFSFNIAAFDEKYVEVIFTGTPVSSGELSDESNVAARFEITVQPFHMLKYCHGVDIPTAFREKWYMWGKTDYINVYVGDRSWRLEIKHRADWKRATINKGWLQLRDDLQLMVGDRCIFECCKLSYKDFSLVVEKGENDV